MPAGLFPPIRPRQGLDHRGYSPTMRAILVAMAIAARSFAEAAKLAGIAAELKISPRHLQTLCQEQGGIGVDEQTERTTAYKDRPLMTPTTAANPPIELAAVMIDGGRIQVRQPDHGPGVHEPAWRETKTAVLLRMKRQVSDVDPQPNLPTCFAGPLGSAVELPPASESATPAEKPDWRPVPVVRSGLATLNDSETFGWMAAAAADRRGFFTATAKAFVSDGLPYNWSIQRRHFADFEPILDFVHAAEHVHAAAKATGQGVELGRHWAESCWEGRVGDVLGEIADHQSRIDPPTNPKDDPDHPWCVLDRERGYLENNQSRHGLPALPPGRITHHQQPGGIVGQAAQPAPPKGARNSGTTTPTPRPCSTSARLGSTTTRNSSTRFATGQVIPTRRPGRDTQAPIAA